MKNSSMGEQFDLLRANIEASLAVPAAILVSSACASDGKSVTAYGLASSFASSGYRTALIDANHFAPTIGTDHAPLSLEQFVGSGPKNFDRPSSDGTFNTICFIKESLRRNASKPALLRAIDACKETYEVVIIDAAPLNDSTLAMMLSKQANGVVLTVRGGRAIKRADHELIKAIDNADLPLLGTVSIDSKVISRFNATVEHRRADITTLSSLDVQQRARATAS